MFFLAFRKEVNGEEYTWREIVQFVEKMYTKLGY